MMPKKSPVSHTVPTRSTPDLPNTEKDLTESTGMVLVEGLKFCTKALAGGLVSPSTRK